jgi:hypothetical protein
MSTPGHIRRILDAMARRNLQAWLKRVGLPYHSPHKFRYGHIHYGLERSNTIADYKAVSLNVMHASMEITDEFYSNLDDVEIQKRISGLSNGEKKSNLDNEMMALLDEFFDWKKNYERNN